MDDLANQLLPFVPEKYRHTVAALLLVSPYITRAIHALTNGGGLRGVLCSIWFGTNVPKSVHQAVTGNTQTFSKPENQNPPTQ